MFSIQRKHSDDTMFVGDAIAAFGDVWPMYRGQDRDFETSLRSRAASPDIQKQHSLYAEACDELRGLVTI